MRLQKMALAFGAGTGFAGLLVTGFLGFALAQNTAAPTAPAPAAQSKAPPALTPEQLAAGKEVVLGSGISRSFGIFVPQIEDRLTQTLTTTRPEIADDLATVLKQLEPEFHAKENLVIDRAAAAFASRMSVDELKQVAAFFNSPAGKKYVNSEPAVLDQIVGFIQIWTVQISDQMLARVREEMKKKGYTL